MLLANKSKIRMFAFFASLLMFFSISASAITPTQQQIQQFKKLSPAQQQMIAKQYGFDLNALSAPSSTTSDAEEQTQDTVLPRTSSENDPSFEEEFSPIKKPLERFGTELFASEPSTFTPLQNVPVPSDYVLGPGDSLVINIYGSDEQRHELTVDREGTVMIPNVDPVSVVGMTYSEAKYAILQNIEKNFIGSKATVSMGKLRTIRVFVLGESYKPGAYAVSSLSTITNALFVSGGITDIGSTRNIQLKRAGKVVANLDLYDLLINGDNSKDLPLQAGDVVFVPSASNAVSVEGEVRREAIYELKASETFDDLIHFSGGFKPGAKTDRIIVQRYVSNGTRSILNMNLSKGASQRKLEPKDGDILTIKQGTEEFNNTITLIGTFQRPGLYQWAKGSVISDYLNSQRGDLLPISDLDYGLVIRQDELSSHVSVIQFSPREVINGLFDLPLMKKDSVMLFSRFESKKAEKRLLSRYAVTEDEYNQSIKQDLWAKYQNKKFLTFIEENVDEELTFDSELMEKDSDTANVGLNRLTRDREKLEESIDYSLFSRYRLLAPLILMLREQSHLGEDVQLVEVDGQVKVPGIYPLPINGDLNKLIAAAGGLNEAAYLQRAEVTRVVADDSGTSVEHININLHEELASLEHHFSLQSKDRINILPIPNWQESISIRMTGEVKFPGTYTIKRGESLSSVIERAGGLTNFADPKAAVFTRYSLKQREKDQLDKLANELRQELAAKNFQSNNTLASTNYSDFKLLLDDLNSTEAVGRLVIDLPAILSGGVSNDVNLESGDALYIPSKRQSINVIGEVYSSASHMFDQTKSLQQYIDMSGGFKQRADDDSVYIIKSNGSVVIPRSSSWFAVENTIQLEPGDTIVVPMDTEYVDNLTLWNTATQIVYQLAVTVAAIGRL